MPDPSTQVTENPEVRPAATTPASGTSTSGPPAAGEITDPVFTVADLNFFYGSTQALGGIDLKIGRREITALIGPSGCGKTTFLRCLNRLNDLIPGTRIEGQILFLLGYGLGAAAAALGLVQQLISARF